MDQSSVSFWQNHSIRFLEMALQADRREVLSSPDGYARVGREECGDSLEIYLMVRDGTIRAASFETNGCLYVVACANTVTFLAEGKTFAEAQKIVPEDIMAYLETLPEEEAHCAELAVAGLRTAIADAREIDRSPWKKAYRDSKMSYGRPRPRT